MKWTIDADVPEEDATKYDALANLAESVFQGAIEFSKHQREGATTPEWLNGVISGVAEVSNLIICPEEYENPRSTAKMAMLRLASILVCFSTEI